MPMHVLDAFFHPAGPDDVARAQRLLTDPEAPETQRSHGRVRKAEALHRSRAGFRTERDGLHCQRIFGPTGELRCLCGRLAGAEHAGVTCARCGVLCGSSALRTWRLGHVEVGEVVHPVAFGPAADALGWPVEDVVAVVHGEARVADDRAHHPGADTAGGRTGHVTDHPDDSGPLALLAALERVGHGTLAAAATVRLVPVPPPGDRPLVRAEGPTAVHAFPGGIDSAYGDLITRANRLARLIELDAPPIIASNERVGAQLAFEACLDAVTGRQTAPRPRWEGAEERVVLRPWPRPERLPEDVDERVHGLLWVDDERLLVDRMRGSWLVSRTGEVLATFPPSGRVAVGVRGERVVYGGWIGWLDEWASEGWWERELAEDERWTDMGVLDLRTGQWAERWPDDLEAVQVDNEEPEDLYATDQRTGRRLRLRWGGDRPGTLARTRDGRFTWVGEDEDTAVIETATGVPHAQPPPPCGDPDDDLPLAGIAAPGEAREDDDEDDDEDEGWWDSHAPAVGLTPAGEWRFLHGTGELGDADALWVRLDSRSEAAAFDTGAARLALAFEGVITIVSAEPAPRVLARFAVPGWSAAAR